MVKRLSFVVSPVRGWTTVTTVTLYSLSYQRRPPARFYTCASYDILLTRIRTQNLNSLRKDYDWPFHIACHTSFSQHLTKLSTAAHQTSSLQCAWPRQQLILAYVFSLPTRAKLNPTNCCNGQKSEFGKRAIDYAGHHFWNGFQMPVRSKNPQFEFKSALKYLYNVALLPA